MEIKLYLIVIFFVILWIVFIWILAHSNKKIRKEQASKLIDPLNYAKSIDIPAFITDKDPTTLVVESKQYSMRLRYYPSMGRYEINVKRGETEYCEEFSFTMGSAQYEVLLNSVKKIVNNES